jgi:hypothetical protein
MQFQRKLTGGGDQLTQIVINYLFTRGVMAYIDFGLGQGYQVAWLQTLA